MNTNNNQQYASKDGSLHSSKLAAKIDDLTPGSNTNTTGQSNQAYGQNTQAYDQGQSGQYGTTGTHSTTTGGLGAGSGERYVANDGDTHRTATGAKIDSVTPSSNQHSSHGAGLTGNSSSNNATYLSNDGTAHSSKIAAKIDDLTPNRNQHSTGTASSTQGYGQAYGTNTGSNDRYVANDGDTHKTALGAKVDSATPSSNNSGAYGSSNTNTYGSSNNTGLGQGNYMSNDGDTHKSKLGAKVDSATPTSNTHGTHGTTHGTTGTTHGSHTTGSHDPAHKAGFMDKIKGNVEAIQGKLTHDPVKVEHGKQVASGLIDPKAPVV